jgi:hypothetical protein
MRNQNLFLLGTNAFMKGATTIMMSIHFQPPLPAYTFIMKFDHGRHWVQQAHSFLTRKLHPVLQVCNLPLLVLQIHLQYVCSINIFNFKTKPWKLCCLKYGVRP